MPDSDVAVAAPEAAELPKHKVRKVEWKAKQREQRKARTTAKKQALQAKRDALGLKEGDPQPEDATCVKAFTEQLVQQKAFKLRRKLRIIRCEVKTKIKKATGFEVQRIARKLKRIRSGKPKAGERESDIPELEERLGKVKAMGQDALIECVVHRIKKQSEVIRGMLGGAVEPSEEVQKHLEDKLARHLINHLSITNTVKKHVLDLEGVITEKNKKPYKLQKKEERKLELKRRAEAKERAKQRKQAETNDDGTAADKAESESEPDNSSSSDSGSNSGSNLDSDVGSDSDDDGHGYESTSDLDADASNRVGKKATAKSKTGPKSSTFVGKLGDFVSDNELSACDSDDSDADEAADSKRKRKGAARDAEKPKRRKGGDDSFVYDEKADADFSKLYEGVERKNRPGQRARRQKFEKMYGKEANHVKLLTKDKKPADKPQSRVKAGGNSMPKPANATAGTPAAASEQMHPSWEAKRRQKEILEQAKAVKGNRIVFD
ncbi:hypothetical protein H4R26_001016 [Coemansia thaxteri]|uniref:Bud22 domain-containing protein n=1 Tax=Coemansia thaxteri TaxID=2663907 RepID=A0A9W8BHC0_9FUNG|nr:hypothetical protein H4R26_001016 [Coemansia thaxteri]KAJ2487512.1 hypothetical protein EV174_000490 [Coemansia sp. RSA 2320]